MNKILATLAFVAVAAGASSCRSMRDYTFVGTWHNDQGTPTYSNPTQHIKLTLPDPRWQVYTDPHQAPDGVDWKTPGSGGDGSYQVLFAASPPVMAMAVLVEPLAGTMTIDEYAALARVHAEKQRDGVELKEFGKVKRGDREIIRGVVSTKGDGGEAMTVFTATYVEKDRSIVLVFMSAQALFAEKEPEFWKIVDSFEYSAQR